MAEETKLNIKLHTTRDGEVVTLLPETRKQKAEDIDSGILASGKVLVTNGEGGANWVDSIPDADNVIGSIDGHALNTIFEDDGITVRAASHATIADTALTADHATNADSAESAASATFALSSGHATEANTAGAAAVADTVRFLVEGNNSANLTFKIGAAEEPHSVTVNNVADATNAQVANSANAIAGSGKLGTTSGTTVTTDRQPDHIFETNSNTVKRASALTYYKNSNNEYSSSSQYANPLHIVKCTAAQYNSMTIDSDALYIITE